MTFNVFEQPWLFVFLAIVLLGVLWFIRPSWSDRIRWWQVAIPFGVAMLGFLIDGLIATDREKIESCLNGAIRVAVRKDFRNFNRIFAENYADSHHPSRRDLRVFCETSLAMAKIERITRRSSRLDRRERDAVYDLAVLVRLKQMESGAYTAATSLFWVEGRLQFEKDSRRRWRIRTMEVLTLNGQPFDWGGVP